MASKELQNDTFYLIKLGDYITHHGFDGMDHWTWVYQTAYTYPHFLLCIISYYIYSAFSFGGIYVVTILLYICLGLSVYFVAGKLIKSPKIAGVVAILVVIIMADYVTMRGQMVSYSLFLWEIYWLYKLYQNGRKRYVIYLMISSWLIAMMHGTFWLFTFVLYLPFVAEWLLSKIDLAKINKMLRANDKIYCERTNGIKLIFVALFLSILAGFLTPTRVCFVYPILTAFGPSQSYITEHAPSIILNEAPLYISMIIFLVLMVFTRVKIRVSNLCYILGLFVMALISNRNIALFYCLGGVFIGLTFKEGLNTLNVLFRRGIVAAVPKVFLYISCVVLVIVVASLGAYKNFNQEYLNNYFAPSEVVSYVKNNLNIEEIRLYNHYNIGSYLMFQDIPVFIDSRSDLYQPAFSGKDVDVFSDYLEIEDGNNLDLLSRYGITHVLDYADSKLALRMTGDDGYQELYRDDEFVLFEIKK